MTGDIIATVLGYVLFGLSELLPLINIPANGFLHTVVIGLQNSFRNPEKDIEMARNLIKTKPDFANIVNTISTNSQVQMIINNLLNNPGTANNITNLQNDPIISNILTYISVHPQVKDLVNSIVCDPKTFNNTSLILTNPILLDNYLSLLPTLKNNPVLLDAFKIPQIVHNIQKMVDNPQLSSIVFNLQDNPELLEKIKLLV